MELPQHKMIIIDLHQVNCCDPKLPWHREEPVSTEKNQSIGLYSEATRFGLIAKELNKNALEKHRIFYHPRRKF